jgi:hypothetical protein
MANVSRINGFTVVKHLTGAPFNGQANIYYVASAADEILRGDVVKLAGSSDVNGIPSVDLCGATDVPVGIVLGIINPKLDPNGKMTTGSISLDVPTVNQIAASGAGYLLVADSPDIIMEVEAANGTPAVTDVGLNASHANGTRTAATATSPAYLDFGTEATTNTLNFGIYGFVQRVNNEVGASARMLVRFNRHQFKSNSDTTGTGMFGGLGI